MRRKELLLATLTAVLVAPLGRAQDAPEPQAQEDDGPRYHLQVLQNPYDIASFYRSGEHGPGLASGETGYAPGSYDIANYYRQGFRGGRYGYSRFWSSGYGAATPAGRWPYRRTIGQNGDLYLFAPTILAPIGPLTGVFYDGR